MSISKIGSYGQPPITYTPYKNVIMAKEKDNKSNTDTFTLTKEGDEYLAKKNNAIDNKSITSAALAELEAFKSQMEQSSDDKSANSVMDIAKCMKIARRIMNGDKVPLKDMKFLAEKQPELYKNALMLKRQNPEPKKYKSCLDDEDEENNENNLSSPEAADSNEQFLADALEEMGE